MLFSKQPDESLTGPMKVSSLPETRETEMAVVLAVIPQKVSSGTKGEPRPEQTQRNPAFFLHWQRQAVAIRRTVD